ncbi:YceI family protein [candidate division KSB1 bacterium]|nr:YceI family protein [candidate division KSB1 bacterium]
MKPRFFPIRSITKLGILFMLLTPVTTQALAQVPARSEAGQSLAVPDEQLDQGLIYYVWPGEDTQLILKSRAYLQRVAVTTCRAVGYIVSPFDLEEDPLTPILGGAFRIPTTSFRSGIDGGDNLLQGKDFFNVKLYPEITFEVISITDVLQTKKSDESTTYDLNLTGLLSIKKTNKEITIPAKLEFIPMNYQIFSRTYDDVLILEGTTTIKFADFDWKPGRGFTERVSDEIELDIYLLFSTISPDKSMDPTDNPGHHAKQLKFLTMLRDLNEPDAAYEFGETFMQEVWDSPRQLKRLANTTATKDGILKRDFDFALKAAKRASELNENKDASSLTTIATIYYKKGELSLAIEWQKKAVQLLEETEKNKADAARVKLDLYLSEAESMD